MFLSPQKSRSLSLHTRISLQEHSCFGSHQPVCCALPDVCFIRPDSIAHQVLIETALCGLRYGLLASQAALRDLTPRSLQQAFLFRSEEKKKWLVVLLPPQWLVVSTISALSPTTQTLQSSSVALKCWGPGQ